jgi:replicative DNA helicase
VSRAIPSAPESERALLDMVLDRGSLILARTELAASAFYDPLIRETWAAAEAVWRAGGEVDISTVAAELHSRGRLEHVGGFSWLSSDRMSVVETLPHHLDRVRKAHSQRRLLLAFEDLGKRAFDMDPSELVGLAQAQLMEAVEDKGDPTRSLHAHAVETLRVKMLDRDKPPIARLLTGWPEVDIFGGLPERAVSLLAGGTSHGKSAAARSIVQYLASVDVPSHVFSVEDPAEAMAERALADYGSVNLQTLVQEPEKLQRGEWGRVVEACNRLKFEDRVLLDDSPAMSMERIAMRVRKWKPSHKTRLVVVDYLQVLRDPRCRPGPGWKKDNVELAMDGAKRLAKEQDVAVLLLSQLSREYAKEGRPPELSDLRESGDIENQARVVMAVYRPDRNTKDAVRAAALRGTAIFRCLKNFRGGIGDAELVFDGPTATFRSPYQREVKAPRVSEHWNQEDA